MCTCNSEISAWGTNISSNLVTTCFIRRETACHVVDRNFNLLLFFFFYRSKIQLNWMCDIQQKAFNRRGWHVRQWTAHSPYRSRRCPAGSGAQRVWSSRLSRHSGLRGPSCRSSETPATPVRPARRRNQHKAARLLSSVENGKWGYTERSLKANTCIS